MRLPNHALPTATRSKRDSEAEAHSRLKRFKTVQFFKKAATTLAAGAAIGAATLHSAAPADGFFDATKHHDRAAIKNSVETNGSLATPVAVDITKLADLPIIKKPRPPFEGSRIPDTVSGLQEGQIVQTDGFIHLVADEPDGDYHIQMNNKPTNSGSDLTPCLIVEVPHPDATGDAQLSDAYARVRKFIRDNCFGGDTPSGPVNPPVHVRVTGQLFFDLFHAQGAKDPGGGRGKKVGSNPMHATTIWEIHPITQIQLAP